ncbi:NAD(P)H-quinone oxidoreductase [Williamsia sp. 1138]|uniref:NAD(P)H-quinone oxidoreductase n=1 Tax=Williamsia sp. 1138 TaxID=1903117 RepID=UPI000A1104B7|nr:NAD(P)H-quinone oxidoreductase [Williamsia sp. 1138]OZG29076.1 NAD(P)H-quinone oxidoreductase [Williamsia sp. 1138]
MRAITVTEFGPPENLVVTEVEKPRPGPGEVLIKVAAAGVNRADLLQRQGNYPPPPGASDIIGMEASGTIDELGPDVDSWSPGQEVCALLAGGGYAEYVTVPAGHVLPVPDGVDVVDAAALPEVACTVLSNLKRTAHLQPGELILLHGGASGIGTHAIQWAKELGATVAVTAGSADKLELCSNLGTDITINYHDDDFLEVIKSHGGADVILDIIGAKYLARNVSALAKDGRLVVIGMQGGVKAEVNLGALLAKRGTIHATALRGRDLEDKAAIVADTVATTWPMIAAGRVKPVVGATFPLGDAAKAHALLDSGKVTGKILLTL